MKLKKNITILILVAFSLSGLMKWKGEGENLNTLLFDVIASFVFYIFGILCLLYFIKDSICIKFNVFYYKKQLLLVCMSFCVILFIFTILTISYSGNPLLYRSKSLFDGLLKAYLSFGDGLLLLVLYSTTATLIAPIFEEFLFRGGIISIGSIYMPFYAINTVSSALFTLMHGNVLASGSVISIFFTFSFSFIMGIIYRTQKNLAICIYIHIFWNLLFYLTSTIFVIRHFA